MQPRKTSVLHARPRCRRAVLVVDCRRVEGGVEVVHGDMDDPNMIEVNNKVTNGTLLMIRFEECPIPIYPIILHKPLRWW